MLKTFYVFDPFVQIWTQHQRKWFGFSCKQIQERFSLWWECDLTSCKAACLSCMLYKFFIKSRSGYLFCTREKEGDLNSAETETESKWNLIQQQKHSHTSVNRRGSKFESHWINKKDTKSWRTFISNSVFTWGESAVKRVLSWFWIAEKRRCIVTQQL